MAALVRQSFALPPELVAGGGQPLLGAHVAHGLLVAWWQGRAVLLVRLADRFQVELEVEFPVFCAAVSEDSQVLVCGEKRACVLGVDRTTLAPLVPASFDLPATADAVFPGSPHVLMSGAGVVMTLSPEGDGWAARSIGDLAQPVDARKATARMRSHIAVAGSEF